MRIRKQYQTIPTNAKLENGHSTSSTNGYTCEYINGALDYSTDEQIIGTWLGKPLYRKTVSCGALPNNTSKTISTNIPNISRVVRMYGYSFNGTNTFFPIPHSNPNPVSLSFFNASNDNNGITIQTTIDRSGFTETYVTIEYTKTTD